ncbi:MAG: T1SS-143 repeat domain-containing protein, partial [Alphaproteobacteria bacterium]
GDLYEGDLVNGPLVVNGNSTVDYGGDGAGHVETTGTFVVQPAGGGNPISLTSHGETITVAATADGYTGTLPGGAVAFTLVIDPATGNYAYTQFVSFDHPDMSDPHDFIGLTFGVQAVDNDGDTTPFNIVINLEDAGAMANNDVNIYDLDVTSQANGNVITGENGGPGAADDLSPDGDEHVTAVALGDAVYTIPEGGSASIEGLFGTLLIFSTGAYTYTLHDGVNNDSTDVFTYTLADGDGDTSTATLTISAVNVDDDTPIFVTATSGVSEVDLNPTTSVNGQVMVDFGSDAPGPVSGNGTFNLNGLTSHGEPVTVSFANGSYVGTAGGQTVFTLAIQANGQYTFNLLQSVDHPNTGDPSDNYQISFGVSATDGDGDTGSGTIFINITDDGPVASGGGGDVFEGPLVNAPISVSGNATVDYGADGAGYVETTGTFVVQRAVGGDVLTLTSNGETVTVVAAADGYTGTLPGGAIAFTLVIDPVTGNHTYTQFVAFDHPDTTDPHDVISLTFGAQAVDDDGDTSPFTIVINVMDDGATSYNDINTYDASVSSETTGNVITGENGGSGAADDTSPDGNVYVSAIALGNVVYTIPEGGSTNVESAFGTLLIFSTGAYIYTLRDGVNNDSTDVFTYTLLDGDGDATEATLVINAVNINAVSQVSEAALLSNFAADAVLSYDLANQTGDDSLTGVGNGRFIFESPPVPVSDDTDVKTHTPIYPESPNSVNARHHVFMGPPQQVAEDQGVTAEEDGPFNPPPLEMRGTGFVAGSSVDGLWAGFETDKTAEAKIRFDQSPPLYQIEDGSSRLWGDCTGNNGIKSDPKGADSDPVETLPPILADVLDTSTSDVQVAIDAYVQGTTGEETPGTFTTVATIGADGGVVVSCGGLEVALPVMDDQNRSDS